MIEIKKRIVLILVNVALAIILCVGNIIIWLIPYYIAPPRKHIAYCITSRTNSDGVPIAPYQDDNEKDSYIHPNCQWGDKFYYYSKKKSTPIVKDNKTLNVMGVEMQAKHYEISRFEYSTYLNDMYKAENGDIIGYKCNSDILTYYYADRSSQFNFSKSIKLSNELITSEEKLREVLDPLVASYINISECEFNYYIYVHGETLTFDELSEKGYVNFATVYVTYQRYVNRIATNEVLSYVLNLDGYLRDFQLSGHGEFENLSGLNFDAETYNNIRDSKIRDMFIRYSNPEKLDKWERLAYIGGQYIMIVEIYEMERHTENFTVRIAIPITDAPETNAIKLSIPTTAKIIISVVSTAVIATSIIISRKKSTQIPSEEEQTE